MYSTIISNNNNAMSPVEESNLQIFENDEFGQIRMMMINGEPWFVGKDVCSILGYANASKAISDHVDDDYKLNNESLSSVGQRGGWLINEAGFYSLTLSSKLESAKSFQKWVVSEVLPSIRKHGAYLTPAKIEEVLFDPDLIIGLATELKNERQQRLALEGKIEQDKPKVKFANSLLNTKTCIPAMDLAKILHQNGIDIGQHRMYRWMRDNGYFIKKGDSKNLPTQKAMQLGLFKISEKAWFNQATLQTEISRKTLVTPKGQMYFVDLFVSGKAKYDGSF